MNMCLLALGSNLQHPKRQLFLAIQAIKNLPKTHMLFVAPFYRNLPWGKKVIPDYYNTVVLIKTTLPPLTLLHHCQTIEKKQMRVRREKNAARTIDIDILDYHARTIQLPQLILPHPKMSERDFVQIPLRHVLQRFS